MVRDLRPKACMHPPRVVSRSSSVCCCSSGMRKLTIALDSMAVSLRSAE